MTITENSERFTSVERDALDLNFKSINRWQWCLVNVFVFGGFGEC